MSHKSKGTEPLVRYARPPQTKIVCSLRPSTDSQTIKHLLLCGMNTVRIACAFGTQKELETLINRIRDASHITKRLCGIILETHGTSAMVGPVSITPKTNKHNTHNINGNYNTSKSENLSKAQSKKGLQSIASALNIKSCNIPQNILENASFVIDHIINEHNQVNDIINDDDQDKNETELIDDESLIFPLDFAVHKQHSLSLDEVIPSDIYLTTQSTVRIITDRIILGDHKKFSICFPGLCNKLSIGKHILIHPSIKLEVLECDRTNKTLRCLVLSGGPLKEYSKVEFPSLSMKWGLTQQDVNDIGFAVSNAVDYICISKVKSIEDITEAKEMIEFQAASILNMNNNFTKIQRNKSYDIEEKHEIMNSGYCSIKILAKIEDYMCLDDIDAIITETDGIMIDQISLLHSYSKYSANNNIEEITNKIKEIMITTRKQAKPVSICCEIQTNIKSQSNRILSDIKNSLKLLNDIPGITINPSSFLTVDDISLIEGSVDYNADSICLLSDLNRFKQIFNINNNDNIDRNTSYWRTIDDDILYIHGLVRSIADCLKQKEREKHNNTSSSAANKDYYHYHSINVSTIDENESDNTSSDASYSDTNEQHKMQEVETIFNSMASSAVKSAKDLNCSLIIVFTQSGRIARIVSKYRPHCIVLAITDSETIAKQCMLVSSIFPILVLNMNGTDSLISRALYIANKYKLIKKKNEKVVVLAGTQSDILDEPCDFIMKLAYVDL